MSDRVKCKHSAAYCYDCVAEVPIKTPAEERLIRAALRVDPIRPMSDDWDALCRAARAVARERRRRG